ncbi:MAG: hypothetical protein K1X31_04070, partial [Gemmatimonadaceae bacterium]|nr:hypothetical protein [Gemmatimonadaceae bacterium]
MAKPDTAKIDSLEAILAEKRKHETYLAKLEERRGQVPSHVFNKLRDEYLTKLTDLQVRASLEAESLGESLRVDESAVTDVDQRLTAAIEQRLEGELRAEVGEYDPKDWEKKRIALEASIAQLENEKQVKVAAFERTRTLLSEARGAAAALSTSTAPEPEPPSAPMPPDLPLLAPAAPVAAAPAAPVPGRASA